MEGKLKFGIRKPSIRKSIAARTSVKRAISSKIRAPKGMGWLTNPRKAAYNRIYHRTTKSCVGLFLVSLAIFAAGAFVVQAVGPIENIYLPLITSPQSQPTQVPTTEPTANPQPVTTGNVTITTIVYDGSGTKEPDGYVEIKNTDTQSIQLQNWTLTDNQSHVFTFPSYVIAVNQTCRIFTNQSHPEACGFNYGSSSAIWNNTGDCATLRATGGGQIDQKCY